MRRGEGPIRAGVIGQSEARFMQRYKCLACEYVYDPAEGDPDNGVEAGTPWEDVPDDWVCPLCGVGKDLFEAE